MKPKVSIIVPVYNVEKYLDRCMESLLGQTLKDIEIILVDDGSPDNCPQMCDEYAKRDSRVKVVHKENAGLGYARNSGLEVATGEYVAFVDSDDYVEYDMYERLYEAINTNNVGMVLCGFYRDKQGKKTEAVIDNMPKKEKIIDSHADYITNLIGQLPSAHLNVFYGYAVWNILFSNEIIKKHQIRFKSERVYLSEDILFQVEYAAKIKTVLLYPTPFYNYCLNPGTLTTKYDFKRYDKAVVLYEKIKEVLADLSINIDNIELRAQRMLLAKTLYCICDAIKGLSLRNANREVRKICCNPVLRGILEFYPIEEMTLKLRLFYLAIKHKRSLLIVILYKLLHL